MLALCVCVCVSERETGNEKMTEKDETVARCFIDRRYIYSLKVGSASLTVSNDVRKAICIKCIKLDSNLMAFTSSQSLTHGVEQSAQRV
jgi:hypothetical protein